MKKTEMQKKYAKKSMGCMQKKVKNNISKNTYKKRRNAKNVGGVTFGVEFIETVGLILNFCFLHLSLKIHFINFPLKNTNLFAL